MSSGRVTSAPCLVVGSPIPRSGASIIQAPTRPPAVLREDGTCEVRLGSGVRTFTMGMVSLRGARRLVVVSDPAMPPDEVQVMNAGGEMVRLLNVGNGGGAS